MVELLHTIGNPEQHTQRTLAGRLGVALGLTNSLLKRCLNKGLIKFKSAPARRYTYYLTPTGFAEKSRLVTEYLGISLAFFRKARIEYEEGIKTLASRGIRKVALAGSGELAEIALLSATGFELSIVAVIAPEGSGHSFHGKPIVRCLADAQKFGAEAVIITDSRTPQHTYDLLLQQLSGEKLIAPPLLRVTSAIAEVE